MVEWLTHPGAIILGLAVVGAIYMAIEARMVETTETTLTFDNLPETFDGFRIVLVSDFHSTAYGPYERAVVRRIGAIRADLLVIAGDLKARNPTKNQAALELLDALVTATRHYAFKPVYARGNHDRRGFSLILDKRRDLHALRDRSIVLQREGMRVRIAGVRRTGRVPSRMRHAFRKAMRGVDPENEFVILVAHTPDYLRLAARRGVDLVLSGDTHGGQICLPWFGPVQSKSRLGRVFNRGHVRRWGAQVYITRGIGTTGPPFRLACRPEISVLTLRRSPEAKAGSNESADATDATRQEDRPAAPPADRAPDLSEAPTPPPEE